MREEGGKNQESGSKPPTAGRRRKKSWMCKYGRATKECLVLSENPRLKKGGRIPKVIASVNWIFRPSSKENKQKGGRWVAKTGGIDVFVYVSENFAPSLPARATQGTVKGGAGPPIHPTSSRQAGWGESA